MPRRASPASGSSVLTIFVIFVCVSKCLTKDVNETELSFNGSLADVHYNQANTDADSNCGNRPWLRQYTCECADPLDGIVYCDTLGDVFVKSQFCMSIYHGEEVVGRCPYTYVKFSDPNTDNIGLFYKVPNQMEDLERALCGRLNRQGLLCGKCKEDYGYAMYPLFSDCVECPPELYTRNWVLYVVVSYVPLTVFLILVVCLKINAASAPLNAFVFISQVFTQPPFTRGFIDTINQSFLAASTKGCLRFLHSLYGIWNLDFFVTVIPPFCLPLQNVFSAITLTYVVAFYPLVVLILLYISIELHSRDFKIFVLLGKPFHMCYVRCKRHWDVRESIVGAFATFFLLSYVKLLFISFDLLSPTILMNKNGSFVGLVSYFDASFSVSPTPTTVLIIVGIILLLVLFTILPVVLLLLYPCGFCQRCLTKTRLNFRLLHFLIYSFNVCYKDGTGGSLDCRFFAASFLVVRLLISMQYIVLYFNYLTYAAITCTAFIVLLSVVQPYNSRNSVFNRLDSLMIFFLVVWLVAYKDLRTLPLNQLARQRLSVALCFISLLFPLVLITLYLLRNTLIFKKWWKRSPSSESLEDLIEQRTHLPHVLQSGYINAEAALGKDSSN